MRFCCLQVAQPSGTTWFRVFVLGHFNYGVKLALGLFQREEFSGDKHGLFFIFFLLSCFFFQSALLVLVLNLVCKNYLLFRMCALSEIFTGIHVT
jgi:hypothetical protein